MANLLHPMFTVLCTAVVVQIGCWTCNSEVASSNTGRAQLCSNLTQIVLVSPSSRIWYRPKGVALLWLERWLPASQRVPTTVTGSVT